MFDVGSFELLLILILALIILGPEQLKSVAKYLGSAKQKITKFITDVKEDIAEEIDDEDLKKMLNTTKEETFKVMKEINPIDKEFEDDLRISKELDNLKKSNDKYSGFN